MQTAFFFIFVLLNARFSQDLLREVLADNIFQLLEVSCLAEYPFQQT